MELQYGFAFLLLLLETCCVNGQTGPDLYCKSCASARSLRHCQLSQKDILCPKGQERCLEVEFVGDNGRGFVRDCVQADLCFESKLPQCIQITGNSSFCSFSCCRGDLCNAGAPNRVSGISMISCAILGLVMSYL